LAATREKPMVLGRAEQQAEVHAGPEAVL
jgi:hypothetical protein